MKASWTGWFPPSPSTVVISRPSARGTSSMHVEIGSPSKSAVHAPHTPTLHVWRTLVRSSSRLRTLSSISSGRASTSTGRPFTVNATFKLPPQRPGAVITHLISPPLLRLKSQMRRIGTNPTPSVPKKSFDDSDAASLLASPRIPAASPSEASWVLDDAPGVPAEKTFLSGPSPSPPCPLSETARAPAFAGVSSLPSRASTASRTLRRDRQIRDVDATGVEGVADGGRDRREGGLAEALNLPALALHQFVGERHGHVVHRRDVVVGEVGVGDLAFGELVALEECGPEAHDHGALVLELGRRAVYDSARVDRRVQPDHVELAGLLVHLDLGGRRPLVPVRRRHALAGVRVQPPLVDDLAVAAPAVLLQVGDGDLEGPVHHMRRAAGCRAGIVRDHVRVRVGATHPFHVDA